MADPEVILNVVMAFVETVDVTIHTIVAHVGIITQAIIPLPSAGGAHRLEGGGTLVDEDHVVHVALAVYVNMHTHSVADMQHGVGAEEAEAAVGSDQAEGLAEADGGAVVTDAVQRQLTAAEDGAPGGLGRGIFQLKIES